MKKLFTCAFATLMWLSSNSQNNQYLYVEIDNVSRKPINDSVLFTNDMVLNDALNQFRVIAYYQSFPESNNVQLDKYYEMHALGNIDSLYDFLLSQNLFPSVQKAYYYELASCICPSPLPPVNDLLIANGTYSNWPLSMIQANCAWSITTGNPSVPIGIVDSEFDLSHPDLAGEVNLVWDPNSSVSSTPHGTSTSGIMTGKTNNNIGLASIGYNTKAKGYRVPQSLFYVAYPTPHMWNAVWKAYLDGNKIINISWVSVGSYPDTYSPQSVHDAVQEMIDNGVSLVCAAGNSTTSISHQDIADIPGVVIVSSVDQNNNHGPTGHAHNNFLDICAPGYNVPILKPVANGSYGIDNGTSYAAPIVSGVLGLMLSVNPSLSPIQRENIIKVTADPINDAASFPGLLGAGRINAYKALLMVQSNNIVDTYLTISANTTWTTPHYIHNELTIDAGATLTVKSTVSFAKNAKIIVKRGGTLIIDTNGKLTNYNDCESYMWQGVEVWGDVTKSQLTPGAQGKLIMKNGAIIENAVVAVSNLRKTTTGYDPLYSGGIIQASNSQFINCGQNVNIMFYNNFHPTTNTLLNDLSVFRDCKFIVNSPLADPTISPDKMVNLYNTIGVRFLGCEFKNTTPVKGIAIWSIDAKYTVDDLCLNPLCTSVKRNVFEGHKYAVYSSNSNPLLAVKINHAIFNNNKKDGVHLAGMNYATVTNCDFEVNGALGAIASGLYLDNCKYYSVQNNNFTSTATYSSVGIYVKDSKNGAHELYKNKFTNLNVGIMPLQDNSGATNIADGLTMHCNEFISNSFDIAISSPSVSFPSSIAWVQGIQMPDGSGLPGSIDPKKLVRNIYSASCAGTATENKYYIKNSTYSNKAVIHASNQQAFTQPLPQPACSDLNVNVIPTTVLLTYQDDCPDNTVLNKPVLSAKIVQLGTDVTAQKVALANLIDGGNTTTLLNAINSNMSPGNLKNLLMSKSPYLSDEVLIAYITKANTPPNGNLKEVIIANSPVTAQVKVKIDALNLPNGIKQQINAAQTGISARNAKEISIITTAYEKELAISDKIRYFLNDTTETNPVDSIIAILKQYPRSENSCEVVGAYLTKGDLVKAQAVVDSLEAINQLDDFCKFQKIIIQLNQTLEKCYKMQTDVSIKQQVEAAADDCTKDGCCNAQALLKQVFNYQYDELRMLPEEERSMLAFEEQSTESVNGLNVYPNPATNELNFVFNSSEAEAATIELRDVTGRLLETLQIKNGTTVQLNVSAYENAIYLLSLNINGKFVENRKLVIVK
jgi:hypothetical protein